MTLRGSKSKVLSVRRSSYPLSLTALVSLCSAAFVMLLLSPSESSALVRGGLYLCALTVVPALFPFMALSEIIICCLPRRRSKSHILFAFFLGILCGAPVGAKCLSSLCADGCISADEYSRLLPLCNMPSAPFVISAVGEMTFGSRSLGIALYLCCLASNILCGLFVGRLFRKNGSARIDFNGSHSPVPCEDFSAVSLFCSSVCSAALSVISVCAFVTFFYTLSGMLREVISLPPLLSPLFFGFFEMTGGVSASPSAGDVGKYLAAGVLGWSGLSVHLQIVNLCRSPRPSFVPYFLSKALSSVISPLILFVFCS